MAHNWTLISHFAFRGHTPCSSTLQSGTAARWVNHNVLLDLCYTDLTPHGPVLPWDGELVFDNPRAPPHTRQLDQH